MANEIHQELLTEPYCIAHPPVCAAEMRVSEIWELTRQGDRERFQSDPKILAVAKWDIPQAKYREPAVRT